MVLVQFCGNSILNLNFFKHSEFLILIFMFFSKYPHMWVPSSEGSLHRAQWQLEKQKTWISFAILNLEEFCLLTWRTSTWRCPFFVESCQQLRKHTFNKSEREKFLWFARFVGTWLTLLRSPPPSWSAPGTLVPSSGPAASGSWCCCWTSQSQTSTVQRPQIKPKGKIVNM